MNLSRRRFAQTLALIAWVAAAPVQAGADDHPDTISNPDVAQALRAHLETGVHQAIAALGQKDGFFSDPGRRIGLPKNFAKAERFLRGLGHGHQIDALVLAMNRAAESATPGTEEALIASATQLNPDDAKTILAGGADAAVDYFRKSTEVRLAASLLPAIKMGADKSDLTRAYGDLAGVLARFGVRIKFETIDKYVNEKTLDGIYTRIGEEARNSRANATQYADGTSGRVMDLLK